MTDNSQPVVSIFCITYNHENFLREAIESFLIQKTKFPIEIIIHDDASTDNTADIIKEYQLKNPNLIKAILQSENQYASRGFGFMVDLFNEARGKYIALCEGDDYWTDPLKLQKQVDFLEANPDFAICFHNVQVVNLIYPEKSYLINSNNTKNISTLEDLLEGVNYIGTTSMMLKAATIPNPLPLWFSQLTFGDYGLSILCASQGKIKYINQVMGVYRVHSSGIYGQLTHSSDPLKRLKSSKTNVEFWFTLRSSGLLNLKHFDQPLFVSICNLVNASIEAEAVFSVLIHSIVLILHFPIRGVSFTTQKVTQIFQQAVARLRSKIGLRTKLSKLIQKIDF